MTAVTEARKPLITVPTAKIIVTLQHIAGIIGMILMAVNVGQLPPNLRVTVTAVAGALVLISHLRLTQKT